MCHGILEGSNSWCFFGLCTFPFLPMGALFEKVKNLGFEIDLLLGDQMNEGIYSTWIDLDGWWSLGSEGNDLDEEPEAWESLQMSKISFLLNQLKYAYGRGCWRNLSPRWFVQACVNLPPLLPLLNPHPPLL